MMNKTTTDKTTPAPSGADADAMTTVMGFTRMLEREGIGYKCDAAATGDLVISVSMSEFLDKDIEILHRVMDATRSLDGWLWGNHVLHVLTFGNEVVVTIPSLTVVDGKIVRRPAATPAVTVETLNEYQREASKTRQDVPIAGLTEIVYPALGLVNEAGEFAGKVKKIFRDKGGAVSDSDREALKYELGDVLWYLARNAAVLNLSLQEIASANLAKLSDRMERGAIGGEGDKR